MLRASIDCTNCTYSKYNEKTKRASRLTCIKFGHVLSDKYPLSGSCKFYNDKEEERISNKRW